MNARPGQVALALALAVIVCALAYPLVVDYRERALAAMIVERYRRIEGVMRARIDDASEFATCDGLRAEVDGSLLQLEGIALDVGFEPVAIGTRLGFRPVFVVCGSVGAPQSLNVARHALQRLTAISRVEVGAVVRDSAVSFGAPLSAPDRIACLAPPTAPPRRCDRTEPPSQPSAGG
ncbi:MAG: hypothetical protein KDG52_00220 [Rhodocyclaceae bacterium]|nr:hypothetical protein [Rhodocyclaceae bacterium]